MLKQFISFLLDQIYPRRCPLCDRVLPILPEKQRQRVCPDCLPKLSYVRQPYCMRCGKPLRQETAEYCGDCAVKRQPFHSGRSVFLYRGAMKEAMYRFKYSGRREYARFFAEEALFLRRKWILSAGFRCIVPIPLYAGKKRKRGYNQAEDFAAALGKASGIPVRTDLIRRTRNTVPMKGLSGAERQANIRGAFSRGPGVLEGSPEGIRILLVDDIYTTGSTIRAAARLLQQEFHAEVRFLAICIGKDSE